jgi:NACalpha-BTF3-like transcription factor
MTHEQKMGGIEVEEVEGVEEVEEEGDNTSRHRFHRSSVASQNKVDGVILDPSDNVTHCSTSFRITPATVPPVTILSPSFTLSAQTTSPEESRIRVSDETAIPYSVAFTEGEERDGRG